MNSKRVVRIFSSLNVFLFQMFDRMKIVITLKCVNKRQSKLTDVSPTKSTFYILKTTS